MRLRHLTLVWALAAVAVAIVGSYPADAARFCKCTAITPGGYCTEYADCQELLELAGPSPGNLTPFRNTKACRRSQALQCDSNSCRVVCDANQK
jgi:hypothetical protein